MFQSMKENTFQFLSWLLCVIFLCGAYVLSSLVDSSQLVRELGGLLIRPVRVGGSVPRKVAVL